MSSAEQMVSMKLDRANEHLGVLHKEITGFLESEPFCPRRCSSSKRDIRL